MKTGLMGGTFNPIHNAHLKVADEAMKACDLDRVVFIPAADPPHKPLAGDVSFEKRSRMVNLAIAGHAGFEISTIEGERGGKSYSIDTILAFRKLFPEDELFFIIGGDSFLEIGLWRRFADIFRSCSLIVVTRPGSMIGDPREALPVAIRGEFSYDAASRSLRHASGHSVLFVPGVPQDISSTGIRQRVAAGSSIEHLVPSDVATYISQQRIYHTCR